MKQNNFFSIILTISFFLILISCKSQKKVSQAKTDIKSAPDEEPIVVVQENQLAEFDSSYLKYIQQIDQSMNNSSKAIAKNVENAAILQSKRTSEVIDFASKVSSQKWKKTVLYAESYFQYNSVTLSSKGVKELEKFSVDLKDRLKRYRIIRPTYDIKLHFVIEGYADSKGPAKYNQKVSEDRALSISKFFEEFFRPEVQRKDFELFIKAYGLGEEELPIENASYEPEGQSDPKRRVCIIKRKIFI